MDVFSMTFCVIQVEMLLGLLGSTSNHDVQDTTLSALASTLAAAGPDVLPYAHTLVNVLLPLTATMHPAALPCRCRALECAGFVLQGLGSCDSAEAKGLLASSAPKFIQHAMRGFDTESYAGSSTFQAGELRDYGHGLFACAAKVGDNR